MIHINLLGEKPDYSGIYAIQLLSFGLVVLLSLGTCTFLYSDLSDSLAKINDKKSTLELDLIKLKKVTKRVEDLEKNKKLLQEKLVTIAKLKAKKHGPVHILDEMAKAIPERAWLLDLKEKAGTLEVSGIAIDNPTIASFMNRLEESKYFGSVDLVHSTQKFVNDIKLKEFLLRVQVNDLLTLRADAQKSATNKPAELEALEKSMENNIPKI
ncbi:MAG: PilN domain-containing protein [Deltaproteobacteria bacterium]|nr:PilN domain-containing protein [Deltaproteobacteria bacterium]